MTASPDNVDAEVIESVSDEESVMSSFNGSSGSRHRMSPAVSEVEVA